MRFGYNKGIPDLPEYTQPPACRHKWAINSRRRLSGGIIRETRMCDECKVVRIIERKAKSGEDR
jgi:hypothetical protein